MLGTQKKPAARFASAGWISYKNFLGYHPYSSADALIA
jgi:hypothetical protein